MTQTMSSFAQNIMNIKYAHEINGAKETWPQIAWRVTTHVLGAIGIKSDDFRFQKILNAIVNKKFLPGGRYLYAAGRPFHQVQNCLLLRAEDSREGWADLMHKAAMALMTGAGIGVDYSDVRAEGELIKKTGGLATGPCALMQILNESGRHIQQGGSRRSAIWAGLNWAHKDIFKFIKIKNWSDEIKALKAKDFNAAAPLDGTNISVQLDDSFFNAFHSSDHHQHKHAQDLYWTTIRQMLETGEPGFSIDVGPNSGETLRNACTEVSSYDDSDICNIGSLNISKINSLEEMTELVDLATLFLIAGTVYSDLPYEKVGAIREKNRRLGLGMMGIHEWLIMRGLPYGPSLELGKYLEIYSQSGEFANKWADQLGLSRPIKTRAIAPNGTIGIIAETTTAGEPLFAAALKRRYLEGLTWKYEYVIDPTAQRAINAGISADLIEDSYSIAKNVERRVAFQAWLQKYVDHGISSTINLPAWGTTVNNSDTMKTFGNMLIKYLPELRGITVYPDGSRSGQPLTPVSLDEALAHKDTVRYEGQDVCDIFKSGSCGV